MTESPPIRCISLDVEEYFHNEAATGFVPRDRWCQWPSRVESAMDRLLELLDRHHCRATLFVVGHIAELHPRLIQRCAKAGHEIASHSLWHEPLHQLTPDTFREDVEGSKAMLEDLTGQAVTGYRAPSMSLTNRTAWALDILAELGFAYDASMMPTGLATPESMQSPHHPFYARSSTSNAPILEIPPLVLQAMGRNLPVAGGSKFRLLPLALIKRALRQAASERRPAVLHFCPWEFDPQQPRLPMPITGRMRTYARLSRNLQRLDSMLAFGEHWQTMGESLEACRAMADAIEPITLQGPAAA